MFNFYFYFDYWQRFYYFILILFFNSFIVFRNWTIHLCIDPFIVVDFFDGVTRYAEELKHAFSCYMQQFYKRLAFTRDLEHATPPWTSHKLHWHVRSWNMPQLCERIILARALLEHASPPWMYYIVTCSPGICHSYVDVLYLHVLSWNMPQLCCCIILPRARPKHVPDPTLYYIDTCSLGTCHITVDILYWHVLSWNMLQLGGRCSEVP